MERQVGRQNCAAAIKQGKERENAPSKKNLFATIGIIFFMIIIGCVELSHAGSDDFSSTSMQRRLAMEQAARDNPFLLLPHRPNYILPLAFAFDPNEEPFGLEAGDGDKMEMTFQVSLKLLISEDFLGGGGVLYGAYTNRSWWQVFNSERSRPFRETNHEPELFLLYDLDFDVFGFKATNVAIGASHQSNGQGGTLSRSWNRIYGQMIFEKGNLVLSLKPWYRIPETDKDAPDDPTGDDNPDITHYMGSGQVGLLYRTKKHSFTMMARNNLHKDKNRGAVELGWTYPMSSTMKGYVQVFDGYGESLIDYDHRITRIGVGMLLADWL